MALSDLVNGPPRHSGHLCLNAGIPVTLYAHEPAKSGIILL